MSNFDLRKYLKENKITFNESNSIKYTFGSLNKKNQVNEEVGKYDNVQVDIVDHRGIKHTYYIIYIDSTHVATSYGEKPPKPNSVSGLPVFHVGQLRSEPYYNDMIKWMKTGDVGIHGKTYKGGMFAESIDETNSSLSDTWVLYYTKGSFTKKKIKEYPNKRAATVALNKLMNTSDFEDDYYSGAGISTKSAFMGESISEAAPQMKSSSNNEKLKSIIKQLEVISNDESTYNQSENKKIEAIIKKLRTVWYK